MQSHCPDLRGNEASLDGHEGDKVSYFVSLCVRLAVWQPIMISFACALISLSFSALRKQLPVCLEIFCLPAHCLSARLVGWLVWHSGCLSVFLLLSVFLYGLGLRIPSDAKTNH